MYLLRSKVCALLRLIWLKFPPTGRRLYSNVSSTEKLHSMSEVLLWLNLRRYFKFSPILEMMCQITNSTFSLEKLRIVVQNVFLKCWELSKKVTEIEPPLKSIHCKNVVISSHNIRTPNNVVHLQCFFSHRNCITLRIEKIDRTKIISCLSLSITVFLSPLLE